MNKCLDCKWAGAEERMGPPKGRQLTLRAFALRYTPSKATQLLVSSIDLRFRKAYLALGPAAAELRSYRVQEVTAEPCSSVSAATALVSTMMVSKKEMSSFWLVSNGMLPTYRRLAALPAFSAAACVDTTGSQWLEASLPFGSGGFPATAAGCPAFLLRTRATAAGFPATATLFLALGAEFPALAWKWIEFGVPVLLLRVCSCRDARNCVDIGSRQNWAADTNSDPL